MEKIDLAREADVLFEGLPITPRVLMLQDIINCPDIDALKQVVHTSAPMRSLSQLLVNHPDDYPGGSLYEARSNYLSARFLSTGGAHTGDIKDIGSLLPIIVQTVKLKTSDFDRLGIEITQSELNFLKKNIRSTIYTHLYIRNTINHQNLMFDSLTEVIYNAIESVHIAIAIHEDDQFIGIQKASNIVGKRQYTDYLTQGTLLGPKTILEFSNIIGSFLRENMFTDGNLWSRFEEENTYYIDALNALDELSSVQEIIKPIGLMLRQASGIDTRGYSLLFTNPQYKSWNIIMQLGDLWGTDPLSFESLDDLIFDGETSTGLYQPNHMDRSALGKQSLALYEQILTNDDYHNTYHTMSAEDQKTLKLGLRKLIRLGIQGRGSGPNGEITEADVRKVFNGKIFSVKSRQTGIQEINIPILTENGIHRLWDYHFSTVSFNEKLDDLNEKIRDYRN